MSLNRQIFQKTALVTVIGAVAQVLGFVLTLLIARRFGATMITDAYYLAVVVPVLLTGLIGGVIKLVFVPVFVEERIQRPETAEDVVAATSFFLLLAGIVVALATGALAHWGVLSLGNTAETRELTRRLILELLPVVPLTLLSSLYGAVYNAYQRFGAAEIARALVLVVTILFLVTGAERWGIHSVVAGQVAGQAVGLAVIWAVTRHRIGIRLAPRPVLPDPFRRMLSLSLVAFAGYVFATLNPLVGRVVASLLPEGSVSILSYAEKLATIPAIVIGSGFTGVLVSFWSKLTAEGDQEELRNSVNRGVSAMLMVLLPIAMGMVVLREPLVDLAYRRGAFGPEEAAATSVVFAILALGTVPVYLHMTVVRIFLAEKAMRHLMMLSAFLFALNLVLMLLFVWMGFGVFGIAAASVIAASTVLVVEMVLIHRQFVSFSGRMLIENAGRVAAATAAMIGIVVACRRGISALPESLPGKGTILVISVSAVVGASTYFLLLDRMGHPDVASLHRYMAQKMSARRLLGR